MRRRYRIHYKKKHRSTLWLIAVFFLTVIIVYNGAPHGSETLVPNKEIPKPEASEVNMSKMSSKEINLLRRDSGEHEKMDMETYIIGVLAGEMPMNFEKAALEAQAVVARTYANSVLNNGGELCDFFGHCQCYYDAETLKQRWGSAFEDNYALCAQSVKATSGLIITYKGEVAKTYFHSTCGGKTSSSEEVWGESLPYLQGVSCAWDKDAPRYEESISVKISELPNRLGVENIAVSGGSAVPTLLATTKSGRVESVSFGGEEIKATDFRKKLELNSTNFSFAEDAENLIINTHGYGHGVGLCQHGANGMAKEGYNYEEIITHYYQGVDIANTER